MTWYICFCASITMADHRVRAGLRHNYLSSTSPYKLKTQIICNWRVGKSIHKGKCNENETKNNFQVECLHIHTTHNDLGVSEKPTFSIGISARRLIDIFGSFMIYILYRQREQNIFQATFFLTLKINVLPTLKVMIEQQLTLSMRCKCVFYLHKSRLSVNVWFQLFFLNKLTMTLLTVQTIFLLKADYMVGLAKIFSRGSQPRKFLRESKRLWFPKWNTIFGNR